MFTQNTSDAQVVCDILEKYAGAKISPIAGLTGDEIGKFALVPAGLKTISLKPFIDEFRLRPERRSGTAHFTDIGSFLTHANRFKADHSVIFASDDPKKPSMTSVLDYHESGENEFVGTHFGQHRGSYQFPISDTWKAWSDVEEAGAMSMSEFAEFLEDRIGDVIEPLGDSYEGEPEADQKLRKQIQLLGCTLASPSVLLTLSREFHVNESSKTKIGQVLSSGEVTLQFQNEHTDAAGAPIRVPNMFLIQTQVFRNGPLYRLPVRLRYRSSGGMVKWMLQRLRPEAAFEDAVAEVLERAHKETGLTVLRGCPE